jgi:formylglycine-generating enzyme required for sulfatase activity
MDDDFEAVYGVTYAASPCVVPGPKTVETPRSVPCPGWPFDAEEAKRRQAEAASGMSERIAAAGATGGSEWSIDLGQGLHLEMVLIPAGEFVMGGAGPYADERPRTRVKIDRPFWMGRLEVTNEQYALFDPSHDSRVESKHAMQFGVRGFHVNGPRQPVVRVSWESAMRFCEWLSGRTGRRFSLPTEAQWEYACRAGTASPFWYGDLDTDFAPYANLADRMLREFVCHPYKKHREPFPNPGKYDDWIPKDDRFNDSGFVSEPPGRYQPNAWGLCDVHGNVAEWTRSRLRSYPYREDDGRNDLRDPGRRVARGGSWRDRPHRARSAFRLAYPPYQRVYNVGFRVVAPTF